MEDTLKKSILIKGEIDMLDRLQTWVGKFKVSKECNAYEVLSFIRQESEKCRKELDTLKAKIIS